MHLTVRDTKRHHNICAGMRLREHVFDALTGPQIPFRNVFLPHGILHFGSKSLSFSYAFHDLEGKTVLNAHRDQVRHDIVTGTDGIGQCTLALFNQCLGVIQPNVGTVGQAGNTDHVRKALRLRIPKHLHNEFRSQFGKSQRTEIAAVQVIRRNAECFRRSEQGNHLRVIHRDFLRGNTGQILQETHHRRIIMAENVEF